MIVRMNWRLRAERAAELEIGGISDHFIDIHVGLRAGSGLPYEQRKVPIQFAVSDILRNRRNGGRAPAIERSKLRLTSAAARLITPSARTISIGIGSVPMRKLWSERSV